MPERSIIFTTEMIHAILRGRKTQTRRLMRPQPDRVLAVAQEPGHVFVAERRGRCPFGAAGDTMWVRERWGYRGQFFDRAAPASGAIVYGADGPPPRSLVSAWRPSLFMPRQVCRLTLQVTHALPQRVQEISDADARAEGCPTDWMARPVQWFHQLWDQLTQSNGQDWQANPWVWVVHFRVAQRPALPPQASLDADGEHLALE